MLNSLQKDIIRRSLEVRNKRGDDLRDILKSYKNITYYEQAELLAPYSLTPYQKTLEEVKADKLAELSNVCKKRIEDGVTLTIDGADECFAYSIAAGDQGNIDDLFTLASATKLPQPYHCSGGDCKLYTPEQILELYIKVKSLKAHETTYFNQLREMIMTEYTSEDDIPTVEAITYGMELTGVYLDTYNSMMAQSLLIIQALTGTNQPVDEPVVEETPSEKTPVEEVPTEGKVTE